MHLQPQKEILVEDEKYVVQLYAPTFGLTLYSKLVRLLGEPLLKLIMSVKTEGGISAKKLIDMKADDIDLEGVSNSIGALFQKLPDDQVVPLIQQILSSTFMTGAGKHLTPVNEQFEVVFVGRYNHVFKLVAKTLGAQYPDFLSGLVKRASVAKGAQASNLKKAEG